MEVHELDAQVLAGVTSLGGVLLGGGLSYFVQRFTQNSADQADKRRLVAEWAEARRAERLMYFERFLAATQEAERAVVQREHYPDAGGWEHLPAAMDRVWQSYRMLSLVSSAPLSATAVAHARALEAVIKDGPGAQKTWAYLTPTRTGFVVAAQEELQQLPTPAADGGLPA